MTKRIPWLNESTYKEPLSPACKLCTEGAKMVVLVTGLCPASCFYCPLSIKKGGHDIIFADEWQLKNETDVETLIQEANLIDAKGAGITGGDPLMVPKRVNHYIQHLKDIFGETFHIHLYTSGLKNTQYIPTLASSGLDEIRFHPMPHEWEDMDNSTINTAITIAVQTSMDVAIEIPAIPTMEKEILSLTKWADNHQINWINLNELEFSERNEFQLHNRGFFEKNDISAAVNNSQTMSYDIINKIVDLNINLGVHYCSSSFKDGVQLKNRMLRRAKHIATTLDIITHDATLLKGIIKVKHKNQLKPIIDFLIKSYEISHREYSIFSQQHQIQIPISLLEHAAESLQQFNVQCYISEQYPTHDHLEVERIPLPYKQQSKAKRR